MQFFNTKEEFDKANQSVKKESEIQNWNDVPLTTDNVPTIQYDLEKGRTYLKPGQKAPSGFKIPKYTD